MASDDAVGDDDVQGTIEVAPEDVVVTVVDNQAVPQAYTATLVDLEGNRSDVTDRVVFSAADPATGTWSGATIQISGGVAGHTRVIASLGEAHGDTGLEIHVRGSRSDGTTPPNAGALFDAATESAAKRPAIAYPANEILVPPNLGALDVHWRDTASNNLFEVSLKNEFVDLRIYKSGTASAFTAFTHAEWYALASSRQRLTLAVSGMNSASPSTKGTVTQTIDVTNETVNGGVYYWATAPSQGIYRYDMATPGTAPSSFFSPGQPTACIGCHAISRDGTKIALTLDDADGRGAVFEVANKNVLVPYMTSPQYWNFATFSADATKLVTIMQGAMVLRSANGGNVLAQIPSSSGKVATHPELSPDGTQLANVETVSTSEDYDASVGSIVVRTFDNNANTFGPIRMLVPSATGASAYYPSWSPDGKWIVYTRTTGNSYNNADAEIWVVKADGSKPPVKLAKANQGAALTNSWARWAPFVQTTGAIDEQVYYLTFSTTRAFGVRAAGGTQIWMTPFFPSRADAGQDPSGAAFRLPFQLLTTSNHIAQWTQAVVIN